MSFQTPMVALILINNDTKLFYSTALLDFKELTVAKLLTCHGLDSILPLYILTPSNQEYLTKATYYPTHLGAIYSIY